VPWVLIQDPSGFVQAFSPDAAWKWEPNYSPWSVLTTRMPGVRWFGKTLLR
jgi:hypothetical protein